MLRQSEAAPIAIATTRCRDGARMNKSKTNMLTSSVCGRLRRGCYRRLAVPLGRRRKVGVRQGAFGGSLGVRAGLPRRKGHDSARAADSETIRRRWGLRNIRCARYPRRASAAPQSRGTPASAYTPRIVAAVHRCFDSPAGDELSPNAYALNSRKPPP